MTTEWEERVARERHADAGDDAAPSRLAPETRDVMIIAGACLVTGLIIGGLIGRSLANVRVETSPAKAGK